MENNFDKLWHQFRLVDQQRKDEWFNLFQTYYKWEPIHDHEIRHLWKVKSGDIFKSMMRAARGNRKLAGYISNEIYAALDSIWKGSDFVRWAEKNKESAKKNPDRLLTYYRGGAKSVGAIRKKMNEDIGHPLPKEQVYRHCWGKPDGTMPTQSSQERVEALRKYHEDVVLTRDPTQDSPNPQDDQGLVEAYGGFNKKGRVPGLGSLGVSAKVIQQCSSLRSTFGYSSSGGYVPMHLYEEEIRRRAQEKKLEKQIQKKREEMTKRVKQQDLRIDAMQRLVENIENAWMHFVAPSQPGSASQLPRAPTLIQPPQTVQQVDMSFMMPACRPQIPQFNDF